MTGMEHATVHVNRPGPIRTIVDEPHGDPRWCFRCRKRVPFRFIVRGEIEPSYYEPVPDVRCEAGHSDGDMFPGRFREWSYE